MTGVAAQMCGCPETAFKYKIESEMKDVIWGKRYAILNDLSPAASFIAYNYNEPINSILFLQEAERIISESEFECSWMYETYHYQNNKFVTDLDGKKIIGKINYTVWTDVFCLS